MNTSEIFSLYYGRAPELIKRHELSRGDDDFREVYIVSDGERKLAIKHTSNAFTDEVHIRAWEALIEAYNSLGIYCPRIVKNKYGEICRKYTENERDFFIYAEEYAFYDTAEHIGEDKYLLHDKIPSYNDDLMLSLGKVAAARLRLMPWHTSYCLLEPFCPPDTVDEQTECAELLFSYIYEKLPDLKTECDELKRIFYSIKSDLSRVYHELPTSCFQGDLNRSNILLDGACSFAGLIDFNLSGREPILNYVVREALWQAEYYDKNENGHVTVEKYILEDEPRMEQFLHNLALVGNEYAFTELEREVFPLIFRYINSPWWGDTKHIKNIVGDKNKVMAYLAWLRYRMTRDDIEL